MKTKFLYLSAVLGLSFVVTGCGMEIDETIVSESLEIVDSLLEEESGQWDASWDESDLVEETDVPNEEEYLDLESTDLTEDDYVEDSYAEEELLGEFVDVTVEEGGSYTAKEEVALYIYTYGDLPANYITKSEAQDLGWVSKEGNLWEVAPGMSIGGDRYGNYEQLLPDGKYKECDINYAGGYRGDERIVYSSDGYIYYTDDHYESFTQLYPIEE